MKHLIARFKAFCVSCFPFVAFVMVCVNFFICYRISRATNPQYHYHTVCVTNESVSVVSNVVSPSLSSLSLPGSTNSLSSSLVQLAEPPHYDKQYRYFVLQSRRMCYMDGTYYGEGDVCSKGIILRIFPDCIYLHNGSVIENRLSPDPQSLPSSPGPVPFSKPSRSKYYDR